MSGIKLGKTTLQFILSHKHIVDHNYSQHSPYMTNYSQLITNYRQHTASMTNYS